jgi:two-component system CheB/CheR fusion protein
MVSSRAAPAPTLDSGPDDGRGPAVVGIGASAGGLRALQQFFTSIPSDSGLSWVVILHLDPDYPSQMASLLQGHSAIPVAEATEMVKVEPDRAYIIPPAYDLEMVDGHIGLRERGERGRHAPIDLFFRTLAEAYGSASVGVVLSGTGADGTSGLLRIKEEGGIAIVQEPSDAEYDGMPTSAIATGRIDVVLPASAIPAEIERLRRNEPRLPASAARAQPAASGARPDADERGLRRVLDQLRDQTGHDFSGYKEATIARRLDTLGAKELVVEAEDVVSGGDVHAVAPCLDDAAGPAVDQIGDGAHHHQFATALKHVQHAARVERGFH